MNVNTSLVGRKCNIKIRDDGPIGIEGTIVGAYVNEKPMSQNVVQKNAISLSANVMFLIELRDFDKGKIYEIPSNWVRLQNEGESP